MKVPKEMLIFNLVNNRKSCDQYIPTGAGSKAAGWFVTRFPLSDDRVTVVNCYI